MAPFFISPAYSVPRIIISCYGFLVWYIINWFMVLPNPTTQQTALVTTVAGGIVAVIGLYQHSGRTWGRSGNRGWRHKNRHMMPTIIMPPIQPNINIGRSTQEPEAPVNGGPAGRNAGPYSDEDFEEDFDERGE